MLLRENTLPKLLIRDRGPACIVLVPPRDPDVCKSGIKFTQAKELVPTTLNRECYVVLVPGVTQGAGHSGHESSFLGGTTPTRCWYVGHQYIRLENGNIQ